MAAAKPSLVAQAPLAYNYGYNGLINTAYAGYAAPAVAHAGVYAAPAAAIAVNPYAYANAYPAAEPYIHQEILAEPYIHDASGELSPAAEPYIHDASGELAPAAEPYIHDASGEVAPAAEPYIHQEILAEPYIHQEPIAAPVAVAAAPAVVRDGHGLIDATVSKGIGTEP